MRSAFSNIVNDDVRDGGLVVLSTFTSSSALEWVLHSDCLLSTTACLIRATSLEWVLHSDCLLSATACLIRAAYTAIKKKVIKSGK